MSQDVKQNRLAEVIEAFRTQAQRKQEEEIGSVHCVLIEGPSKKNEDEWTGKTDSSKWVVFDNTKKYGEYSGLDEDEGDTKRVESWRLHRSSSDWLLYRNTFWKMFRKNNADGVPSITWQSTHTSKEHGRSWRSVKFLCEKNYSYTCRYI